jgi:Flp pilus assembly protein TadG
VPPRRRPEGGQATVELALTLPFVAVLLLAVVQVLVVAHAQQRIEHAAREAARVAAVGDDPEAVRRAAALGVGGGASALDVEIRSVDGGLVEVTVRRRFATDVPVVGALTPDLALVGRATFRREGPAELPEG